MAKKSTKKNNFDIKQLMDTSGSYKNLIYGVVTVVILFVIIFLGVRTLTQNQTGDIDEGAVTVDESEGQVEYEVAEGDTLWSISEDVYGTGFNWQIIAEANDLADPNNVDEGTTIIIPELTPTEGEDANEGAEEAEESAEATPTMTPAPTSAEEEIGGQPEDEASDATEYTVKNGDSLWKIAEAQYNDGYRWVDIARANSLMNPDIIHPGNVLVIPR